MITRSTYGRKNGIYNFSEFVVDTESDISSLPTSVENGESGGVIYPTCAIGSKAFVANARKMFMLNNANEWKLMIDYTATGGGGGGGGASVNVEDDGEGNVTISLWSDGTTDEHINNLIDDKLGNLDAAVSHLERVVG